MFTCKSPGGISYVWSPDGGSSFDCKPGKATCKGTLTKSEANKMVDRLCQQYPSLEICASAHCSAKLGIVINDRNRGIGMVTEAGIVRSLPKSLPPVIVEAAKNIETVSVVRSIDEDGEKLEGYIKRKAPPSTKKQQLGLLDAIRQGVDLKKTKGIVPVCDRGWYWSTKLGRCISMNIAPNNQDLIREALEKKFAELRS